MEIGLCKDCITQFVELTKQYPEVEKLLKTRMENSKNPQAAAEASDTLGSLITCKCDMCKKLSEKSMSDPLTGEDIIVYLMHNFKPSGDDGDFVMTTIVME